MAAAPIIIVNSGNNAAAAAAAAARKQACIGFVRDYKHEKASVSEMRNYADCIGRLHPSPMDPSSVIAAKVAIVVVFLCAIAGGVYGWKERDGVVTAFMLFLLGGICGVLLCGIALGAYLGIEFLLS